MALDHLGARVRVEHAPPDPALGGVALHDDRTAARVLEQLAHRLGDPPSGSVAQPRGAVGIGLEQAVGGEPDAERRIPAVAQERAVLVDGQLVQVVEPAFGEVAPEEPVPLQRLGVVRDVRHRLTGADHHLAGFDQQPLGGAVGAAETGDRRLDVLGALAHRPHRPRGLDEHALDGVLPGRHRGHHLAHLSDHAPCLVDQARAGAGHPPDVVPDAFDEAGRARDGLFVAAEGLGQIRPHLPDLGGGDAERLPAFRDQVGDRHRVDAGQRAAVGDERGRRGAGAQLDERRAEQPVRQDRRLRVGAHQRAQILADAHPHHEPAARPVGNPDADHFARRQPRQPHAGADLHSGHVAEVGFYLELLAEQQAAVADQEQADREQQQPADHERADQRQAWGPHLILPFRARLRGRPPSCAAGDDAKRLHPSRRRRTAIRTSRDPEEPWRRTGLSAPPAPDRNPDWRRRAANRHPPASDRMNRRTSLCPLRSRSPAVPSVTRPLPTA